MGGPCPPEECFPISSDNTTSNPSDCCWFKEDLKRCDDHIEGRTLCPSTCNTFKNKCHIFKNMNNNKSKKKESKKHKNKVKKKKKKKSKKQINSKKKSKQPKNKVKKKK